MAVRPFVITASIARIACHLADERIRFVLRLRDGYYLIQRRDYTSRGCHFSVHALPNKFAAEGDFAADRHSCSLICPIVYKALQNGVAFAQVRAGIGVSPTQ